MEKTIQISDEIKLSELSGHASGYYGGYITGRLEVDGFELDLLYRVKDDANGKPMTMVSVDYGDRHPSVAEQWDKIVGAVESFAESWKAELRQQLDTEADRVMSQFCWKNEDGVFVYTPYDVHPDLDQYDIRGILEHELDKTEALESLLYEKYKGDEIEAHNYFTNKLDELLNQDEKLRQMADISNWHPYMFVENNWSYQVPLEDFLKQEVELNIVVDTGDRNYCFTCNNFGHSYYGDPEDPNFTDESSILWLCEQQGLSREDLAKVMRGESLLSPDQQVLITQYENHLEALKVHGFHGFPYLCTGKFAELERYNRDLMKLSRQLMSAQETYANNSLPYSETMKKFPSALVRFPTEESFKKAQSEILPANEARIQALNEELAKLKNNFENDPELVSVSNMYSRYQDLGGKMVLLQQEDIYKKQKFAESVAQECANITSGANALVFLVKMPLSDAIKLNEVMQAESSLNQSYYPDERTGKSSILLGKDSVCGLHDWDNGAGGLFEIELAQDVNLPVKYIYSAQVDGTLGAGVREIWGEKEYGESLKEIRDASPTRELDSIVRDAEDRAVFPVSSKENDFAPEKF